MSKLKNDTKVDLLSQMHEPFEEPSAADSLLPVATDDSSDVSQEDTTSLSVEQAQYEQMTPMLRRAAGFAALGGVLFGYDIGIISGALLQLTHVFDLDGVKKELVVSFMLIGATLASISGGYIIDYFGRRKAIIINSLVFILGAVGLCTSINYEMLLVSRVIVGYGVALSAVAECVYISEISPPSRRGTLVSLNELGVAFGIALSYLVNYIFISTPNGWRYMFGLSVIPALVQGVGMLWLPSSPRWLLLKGRRDEAMIALANFRGSDMGIPHEALLEQELESVATGISSKARMSTLDLFRKPTLKKAMLISCTLITLQQFTGQPNILFYGTTIFRQSGFDSDREATLVNLALGVLKLLSTMFALRKVDYLGRRKLLLAGTTAMLLSLLVLASVSAVYAPTSIANQTRRFDEIDMIDNADDDIYGRLLRNTQKRNPYDHLLFEYRELFGNPAANVGGHGRTTRVGSATQHTETERATVETEAPLVVKWVTLTMLVVFIIAYAFSYGPISWLLLSELFPDDIRARAVAIATIFNWASNLVVSATFLSFLDSIHMHGTFFMYAGINVCAFVFIYLFVPETKGKSLEEIQTMLAETTTTRHPWRQLSNTPENNEQQSIELVQLDAIDC